MPRRKKSKALKDLTKVMKERRRFLQEIIDEIMTRPRLSRGRKAVLAGVLQEVTKEAFTQADLAMELNEQLAAACASLRHEVSELEDQNQFLLTALMDGKTFKFIHV